MQPLPLRRPRGSYFWLAPTRHVTRRNKTTRRWLTAGSSKENGTVSSKKSKQANERMGQQANTRTKFSKLSKQVKRSRVLRSPCQLNVVKNRVAAGTFESAHELQIFSRSPKLPGGVHNRQPREQQAVPFTAPCDLWLRCHRLAIATKSFHTQPSVHRCFNTSRWRRTPGQSAILTRLFPWALLRSVLLSGPFALVAQLDRASVYGTECRKFESCRARRSGVKRSGDTLRLERSSNRSGKHARSAGFHAGPRSQRSCEGPRGPVHLPERAKAIVRFAHSDSWVRVWADPERRRVMLAAAPSFCAAQR